MKTWYQSVLLGMIATGFAPAESVAAQRICAVSAVGPRVPSVFADATLKPEMTILRALYDRLHAGVAPPARWTYGADALAIGTLMFDLADLSALTRTFTPTEIAPYEHQFHGDMIKEPSVIRIGTVGDRPFLLALNRRPGAPLPTRITDFVEVALSGDGQRALLAVPGFRGLTTADARIEREKLQGYLPPLDPALPIYRPSSQIRGTIRSVGSDGMKSLMDGWVCRFEALQPGVGKGDIWEHLGSLNGYDALVNGQTDIAPMGREIWPDEIASWRTVYGTPAPIEIAVARGGFNTPQRTTAQAIFVNPSNPLQRITIRQLAAILGANPGITRWGQLGLTGDWANRAIHIYMPPQVAPNAMSMQSILLHGGRWNTSAKEAPIPLTAKSILDDTAALGFGGLEEGDPTLRTLSVAGDDGKYVPLNAVTASSGRYPLTRYMYIRLAAGRIPPQVAAFLRFILSRDGQERVRYSAYFPLTAAEAQAQLIKLDQAERAAR